MTRFWPRERADKPLDRIRRLGYSRTKSLNVLAAFPDKQLVEMLACRSACAEIPIMNPILSLRSLLLLADDGP